MGIFFNGGVPTLSLSRVFWDVREAMEMVSGWLLASPWLSSSSPSLHYINITVIIIISLYQLLHDILQEMLVIWMVFPLCKVTFPLLFENSLKQF